MYWPSSQLQDAPKIVPLALFSPKHRIFFFLEPTKRVYGICKAAIDA